MMNRHALALRALVAALAAGLTAAAQGADAAPAIPFKQDNLAASASLPGGALGVLLISALAIVAVYLVRKRLNLQPAGGAPRLLRVLESQRLGPRALLSVVEFAGGQYLVAQSEHGITCLAAAPGNPPQAPATLEPR